MTKATLAPVPVVASDWPSSLNARTSPVLPPSVPVSVPVHALTSTSQSGQSSSQSGLSSAQSGLTGTIPPHILPANQLLVPTAQYWYLFPREDNTAPR